MTATSTLPGSDTIVARHTVVKVRITIDVSLLSIYTQADGEKNLRSIAVDLLYYHHDTLMKRRGLTPEAAADMLVCVDGHRNTMEVSPLVP